MKRDISTCPKCGAPLNKRLDGWECSECDFSEYPENAPAKKYRPVVKQQLSGPATASHEPGCVVASTSEDSGAKIEPVGVREFGCLLGAALLPFVPILLFLVSAKLQTGTVSDDASKGIAIAGLLMHGAIATLLFLAGLLCWFISCNVGMFLGACWLGQKRPNAVSFLLLSALLLIIPLGGCVFSSFK